MFIIEKLPANSLPTDKTKRKQWLFPISLFSLHFYKYESPSVHNFVFWSWRLLYIESFPICKHNE